MRRCLSVRIAALLLVVSMAAPAIAAPRDDTPFGRFERTISRLISNIILDLENAMQPPK